MRRADCAQEGQAPVEDGNGLVLLVWDAPNMEAILSRILSEGSEADGPALDAVRRWLGTRGAPGSDVEACMFADLVRGEEDQPLEFLASVRDSGFRIFVKPREPGDRSDLENEILRHIARRRNSANLSEVIVASHDGASFADALEALSAEGVRTTVVGFREFAHFARERDEIELVDIEDDIGAFSDRLPRMRLWEVPNEGTWFEATAFPNPVLGDPQRTTSRTVPPIPTPTAREARSEVARPVEPAAPKLVPELPIPELDGPADVVPAPERAVENGLSADDNPSPAERAEHENGADVTVTAVESVPPPPAAAALVPGPPAPAAPAPPPPPPPARAADTGMDAGQAATAVVGANEMEITDLDDDDESIDLTENLSDNLPDNSSDNLSDNLSGDFGDDDFDLAGPGEDGDLDPDVRAGGGGSGVFDYPESGGPTANLSRRNIRRRRQVPTD